MMKIRVFTDLRFTSHPRQTGVGKHIAQMVGGLSRMPSNDVEVMVMSDQGEDHRRGTMSHLPVRGLPLSWKAAEVLWTLTEHPLADRWCKEADWIYCPKNDFIPVRESRVAVTIHGAHELDPQFPQSRSLSAQVNRMRRKLSYGRILQRADLVLTVSEFLKCQIMDWFHVPEEKFRVVGNGVEMEFFAAAELPQGTAEQPADRSFVLCVGGLNDLDGGDRVLKMAELMGRIEPDLQVVVAGGDHLPELQVRAGLLRNVNLLGYVAAERLAPLMRGALALFYPTRYETFGIAAAEAMAAGTPVVTCRNTAVPEVVGEAGIYIDPDNAGEAVATLRELCRDASLRDSYIKSGRERAAGYSWAACVGRLQDALVL